MALRLAIEAAREAGGQSRHLDIASVYGPRGAVGQNDTTVDIEASFLARHPKRDERAAMCGRLPGPPFFSQERYSIGTLSMTRATGSGVGPAGRLVWQYEPPP